jgi:hypothetical protein
MIPAARSPRSPDRGPVEATDAGPVTERDKSSPRSPDRGPVEADHSERRFGMAMAISPRSPDRGPVEAPPPWE